MSMPRAVRLGLLIVCILASGNHAYGAEPGPLPGAGASAKAAQAAPAVTPGDAESHLQSARQYFQERKYSEAADEMLRAYAFSPKPLFLFNAGQAYRKAARYQEALDMYRHYLEAAPDGPLAGEANGNVMDLQALIKAQENLQDVSLRLETQSSQLELERRKAEAMELALKKERKKPWYKHPAFVVAATAIGVGVVVGAAVALGLDGASRTQGGTKTLSFR